MTQLSRSIVRHGRVDIIGVHGDLALALAIVVVRTVSLFRLKIVTLTILHCLAAPQTRTRYAHVLLRPYCIWCGVVHSLGTLTLSIQQIHFCTLTECHFW